MKFWLARMTTACMGEYIGGVGPVSNFVMGFQNASLNSQINMPEHYGKFLIGFCMLVKKEVIDKIGGLDERFGIGGNDDLDYSIRIRKEGYRLRILRDVFIKHEGTQSLSLELGGLKNVEKLDKKTRKQLIKKWTKKEVDKLFDAKLRFLIDGVD